MGRSLFEFQYHEELEQMNAVNYCHFEEWLDLLGTVMIASLGQFFLSISVRTLEMLTIIITF